ncbi:MAG: T9SS type A sorting domain-containing protein [Bacteroidota bacterium]
MRRIRYLCLVLMLAMLPLEAMGQQTASKHDLNAWVPANTGIETLRVWTLNAYQDSNGDDVLAAGTDAGVYLSLDAGDTWTAAGLDTSDVSALVFSNGSLHAATLADGIFLRENSASAWTPANSGLENLRVGALSIDQNDVLLASTILGGVYRSEDNGANWALAVTSALHDPFVPALVVDANNDMFAGTDDGVLRSIDGGETWSFVNNGLGNLQVESLLLDEDALFAGTDLGMYRSFDNGMNWEAAHTNALATTNVRALVANNNNAIFAGTLGMGVFRSLDYGTTWEPLNEMLPNLDIAALAIADDGTMFAGTVGGGVYRRDAATDVSTESADVMPATFQLAGNYPNPFAGSTTIRFALPEPAEITLTLFDVTGRIVAVLENGVKPAGWHELAFDAAHLPSGVYFYALKASDFTAVRHLVLMK